MKIALCLSGHLRKFEQTFPALHFHFLKDHDCDVFIHTWDQLGYSSPFKTDTVAGFTKSKMSQIENLYKPKKIVVESSDFFNDLKEMAREYAPHLIDLPKPVYHMSAMFYKMYACNEIKNYYEKKNNINYDWVIRARPDLMFHNKIILPATHQDGIIHIPNSPHHPQWTNDQFAIGKTNDMDLYSSAFFDIPDYFRIREEYYPEKFLMWSMNRKQLNKQSYNINFNIRR